MKRQQICRSGMSVVLALAFGWGCGVARGAEVGLALAEKAAQAWVRGGGGFGTLGGAGDEGVSGKTWQDSGMGGKLHVVRVGGGYVVTTADDGLEPIVAWGEGVPEWLEEEGHPFRTLLAADLAMRACGETKAGGPVRRDIRATEQARAQWAALLGGEDGTRAAANGTQWVSEVRHGAMLETKWNQQKNNYGNYRYNLYLPYTETVRLGRGAETRGTVLDQQGDWQLCQTEEGAVKTLWLEKKRGGRAVELAQVEPATAMVTNTWWDEWAGGAKGGGAWVTEVGTVGGEYEFKGFVNAGRAYWEDEEDGVARLWAAECAHPEERILLAEGPMGDESVGGKAAFGARRWRRGVAWTEEGTTLGWEGGETRRLARTKRGVARDEYQGSGSGQYDPSGSGEYYPSGSGDYSPSGSGGYEPVPSGGGGGGTGGGTNYHIIYTVTKHRVPAGCVATAGGQLMNWWKAPSGKVQQVRRTCTVFGKSTSMVTKGGTYNWSGMGGVEPRTAAEGYAVSKLLYDIAVACGADFEKDGTSMSAYNFVSSLTGVFGYAGAQWTQFGSSYNAAALQRAVVPNLDAGAPVMLGIQNPTTGVGHEVVVDGCGTDGGAFALHLNLGWGGSGTMWYKPPQIYPNSSQNYNVLSDVAYNISPSWRGEILSGRVLGPHGRVVGGASVTVRNASGTTVYSGTAGMNGIYAWRGASAGSYTIRVSVGGVLAESSASVATSTGSAVGNGLCDVTLTGVQTVGPVTWSMSAARGTSIGQATAVTLSCATAGSEIRYTLDGSEPTTESALYEGPIVVQGTMTLKAAAFASGMERSPTAAEDLTFADEGDPDNFASARELFGAEGKAGFSNAGYGKESGEPTHSSDGYQGGASAWAKWTAPKNGRWAFALSGTTADGEELDTQLAVYTGTAVGALQWVAANDDTGGTYSSRTTFNAKKGTVYRIAMDTYKGVAGQMTLEWGTNGVETADFSQYGQFMPVGGGTFTATVTSSAPWTLPDVCDWVEALPGSGQSGDTVSFSVQENDDDEGRTGYVYVLAGQDESSEMGRLAVYQTALDFVTNRAAAVARAQAEGKRILMVFGHAGCGNTWATLMSNLTAAGARERLEAGYVLWFCDSNSQWADAQAYLGELSWIVFPVICVLEPDNMDGYLARTTGYRSAAQLAETLGNVVVFRSEEENRNVEVRYPASGTALGALPTAVCAGYIFDGWWTNPIGGTRVTTGTVPGDGVTVYYAHWNDKQVTTFKGNGGTPATQKTTNTVGKTYGTFPTVTWTNHVLLGWYTATNGGTRVLARYDVTEEATRTLYARWTDKQTTIFKGNGGTPGEQVRTNTMGKAYGVLPDATWANHAFLGWYTAASGGTRIATNSTVTAAKERTLYAHWTTNQVTTFKGSGGKPTTLKTTNTIGKTYGTFPTVTWTNHVLLGWYTASNGGTRVLGHYNVTEEATRTLYARWTDKQVTTFQGNGGTPDEQVRTNTMGKAYGTFPNVTWANHAFLGWFTAAEGGTRILTNSTVTVAKARTLYAHWTTNQVTTFKGNGGTPATLKTTNTIGKTYGTFPSVTWTNHVLLGWYTATNGGTRVLGHYNVTEEATRTLYARWTDKQTTVFQGNGGTPAEQVRTNTIGKAYGVLPDVTWANHAFLGWFTAAEGGTRILTNSTVTVAKARTLYAHWTTNQVTTFKGNGGTPATLKTTNTIGKTYGTFPTVTWSNHVFLGWYTATNGGTRVLARYDVTEEATRTLYARWTDKQTTVFQGNGGTPTEQVRTNTMGKAYGTFPNVTWANHAFLGWFTAAAGGTRIATNSTVTVAKERTLYAHWTTNQVTTFKGSGGTPTTLKTTNTIGKTYGTFPAVTWTNHVFLGWYTATNGGTRVLGHYNVTEEATRTLWARWTDQQTTVFQGNGGTPTEQVRTNTMGKAYGTFPNVTWANHAFLGWFTAAEGGTRILTNSTVTVAKERTLWAHWREGAKSLSILGMCMEPRYSMARMAGRSNAEVIVLRFEAEAGSIYHVQWTEKLGGEWETILSWQAADDGEVELQVPMRAGDAGSGFYRVATGE